MNNYEDVGEVFLTKTYKKLKFIFLIQLYNKMEPETYAIGLNGSTELIIENDSQFQLLIKEKESTIKVIDNNDDLVIENNPNFEKIVVKKSTLQNMNSLKICNCDKLKTIIIEDNAFMNVKIVVFESIFF